MTSDFYDELSPFYHLIYANWDESIARQARELDAVIHELWRDRVGDVLDAACGVGTQAIGLAGLGYKVTGSDFICISLKIVPDPSVERGSCAPSTTRCRLSV